MSTIFAAGLLAAAILLTYLFCVRPMRGGRGQCGHDDSLREQREDEIRRLREEIAQAKRELNDGSN